MVDVDEGVYVDHAFLGELTEVGIPCLWSDVGQSLLEGLPVILREDRVAFVLVLVFDSDHGQFVELEHKQLVE